MATQTAPKEPKQSAGKPYAFEHVGRRTILEDMNFRDGAPGPGDRLPAFDLPTTEGGRFSTDQVAGRKPVLLVMGSLTCPMTAASNPSIKALHAQYGSEVEFVMLHVREAHPGETTDQPHRFDEKMDHARELKERDQLPFAVAVDDLEGSVHRAFDEKPNSAWLADRNGTIVFRSLWAGDESGLRQALEAVQHGDRPRQQESTRRVAPMAAGIGMMHEMLRRSGPRALRDFAKAAPPMAAMAWLADKFRPLAPKWRTLAAMATMGGLATAAAVATVRAQRR